MDAATLVGGDDGALRRLEPHWNEGMIVASIAISLLGAFTSTQLMCQAKVSVGFKTVLVWTLLGSLTFGFCSIWGLHFVAMLAYELDILIGINVPLTILSSVLAVLFTFAALGSDLLWDAYRREQLHGKGSHGRKRSRSASKSWRTTNSHDTDFRPLLSRAEEDIENLSPQIADYEFAASEYPLGDVETESATLNDNDLDDTHILSRKVSESTSARKAYPFPIIGSTPAQTSEPSQEPIHADIAESHGGHTESSEYSVSGRSSSLLGTSSTSTFGLSNIVNMAYRGTKPAKNIFIATGETLYLGFTWKNITKGFLWSLAITSMHYSGILALMIPGGHCTLNYAWVILSALISWTVCIVGSILMAEMETHLGQQFLFTVVATTGVTGMHFTGMQAATFWSKSPPTEARGYPPALAAAIIAIAIATCMAANGLLAHAATVSRNKLAEIVWTRKKLWRTIAQKENAEAAAAARSDFIASASHEIRTPLHHLQGYSDLLSQTELTEEGRLLLLAIQRATKTLSLITNNVLDWSKLERDSEAVCRPVALDIRTVCESILVLLPNKDDDAEVDIMVVVRPDVPRSIFLDETYIHRILMNLLSNALKFTRSGYILLLVEVTDGKLVATVKDTGPGVPPSFLPQLFEPFKQAQTRGSQRGTGLGLSIVKQLLHNMNGDISVESKHPEVEDIEPGESGSTFTISIPVQASTPCIDERDTNSLPKVAILHNSQERCVEGLQIAWEKFGFEPIVANDFSDLHGINWKYIWTDISYLKSNPLCLQGLLKQDKWLVLVSYDNLNTLRQVPDIDSAPNIIPIPKPLMWHSFLQRIAVAKQGPLKSEISSRMVRFASKVDIVTENTENQTQQMTSKNQVILLVEDNPINQKLGQKMLAALGYSVLIAGDGQAAITSVLENDATIDAILMDQSMPLKDGITATREIRELEKSGKILRRRPIIAVTAAVSNEAISNFSDAGADDFLAKPLSLGRLEEVLKGHLHLSVNGR